MIWDYLERRKKNVLLVKDHLNDHEEFIEHIITIHPEERPCPKCKGTMRWVDASNVGGSHTQYERPQPACDTLWLHGILSWLGRLGRGIW